MLKSIIKHIIFFCATLLLWRFIHGEKLLTDETIKLTIISSVLIVIMLLTKTHKVVVFSGIGISWLIASGIYPSISQYIFVVILAYIGLAVYYRNWMAMVIACLFVVNTVYSDVSFVDKLKSSPSAMTIDPTAYSVMASKVNEKTIKCDKEKFLTCVNQLGIKHQKNPTHILFVFWAESGLDPARVNPHSNAGGFIQFMPSTCATMNINYDRMLNMDGVSQIALVDKYFSCFEDQVKECDDIYELYLVVFYPAAIKEVKNGVNYKFPKYVVRANRSMLGKDGDYNAFKSYIDKQMTLAGIAACVS